MTTGSADNSNQALTMAPPPEPLLGSYTVRELSDAEIAPLLREAHPRVFSERFELDLDQLLSPSEKEAIGVLRERLGSPFRLNLGVFSREALVGWSYGVQDGSDRFYMINSGVLPEHRNQGIYSALLRRILRRLESEGFQVAHSRHSATNNAVLIPKLRAGFLVTGFELSDRFGTLVQLSYLFNSHRREVLRVRSGEVRPGREVRGWLGLE